VDAGYTPWIRLKEFRKMLKLENNEYARFCDFRQRVIQTAYTELKEKALNDETNCYFELEMRWSSGHVRRGAPDEIRFRVIPSKYGKKKLIVNAVSSEIMELADALVVEFGMTKAVAKRLCERLNENTIKGFKDEMNRIHSVFVGARKVANPTGYAYRSLKNYIDEVTGEKVAEPDLFDNPVIQYAQEVENITPSATAQPSQWDEFMNEIKSAVSKADFDTWFSPMKFKELKGESLRVGIPNRFFMEVIENQFVPMIQPIFKRVFGEEVLLEWVLEHI
jgi:nicotinamide mononucleotide adenylyltransferase